MCLYFVGFALCMICLLHIPMTKVLNMAGWHPSCQQAIGTVDDSAACHARCLNLRCQQNNKKGKMKLNPICFVGKKERYRILFVETHSFIQLLR